MTSTKAVKAVAETLPETSAVDGVQVEAVVVPAQIEKGPTFRDKEFTSRTLILPNGRAVPVVRGRVEATDSELLTFLRVRDDFEPIME